MPRRRALGAALLAATLLLLTLAYLKPNPFARHETVRAMFRDAAGTTIVGGEVRMAGTPVGRVTDRQRIGSDALLTLELDPSVGRIHADATAELRPRTPFEGPAFVELRPGTPDAPRLDGVLGLARTRNYVPLDEALRFAQPATREDIRKVAAAARGGLAGAGAGGLSGTLRQAPALTADLAPAARAARGPHGDELRGAVGHLASTVDEIAQQGSALTGVLRGTQRTAAAFAVDGGAPLDRTIAELATRTAQLDAGGRALLVLVDRLDTVGTALRPTLRALPAALGDTSVLLREARPVLAGAPSLLADLRVALAAGARSAPDAQALLRTLSPTLALLDRSLLPALAKPTQLGMPAYLQFLSLFQGGAGASRPFQTQAQSARPSTGTGHFMRFGARFFTGIGYPLPPCSGFAQANPQLATALGAVGACTP